MVVRNTFDVKKNPIMFRALRISSSKFASMWVDIMGQTKRNTIQVPFLPSDVKLSEWTLSDFHLNKSITDDDNCKNSKQIDNHLVSQDPNDVESFLTNL